MIQQPLNEPADQSTTLRWSIYLILICLSIGNIAGKILTVNSTSKKNPFLSVNDRSRWCTIRALVEHRTYEIDKITHQPGWGTIDMVQHKNLDGEPRLYSSKPTLLPTILAGEYWLIHKLTGKTLGTHPYVIGRAMLLSINGLSMLIMLLMVAKLAERFGTTDWGRIFVVAAASLGTFISTFSNVLNNHSIAAASVSVAIYCVVRILFDDQHSFKYYILAGLSAAFTAANELPALSIFLLITLVLLWKTPKWTLIAYLPAAMIIVAGFFGTNYIAHNSWRPAYAHRSETDPDDHWYRYTYKRNGKEKQSYWMSPKGIDRGEPLRTTYAMHMLVGHHGIFSLTPVWLLSVVGAVCWLFGKDMKLRLLALSVLALSVVCITFFIMRPLVDRNYGGVTSGFRWLFWFTPLWLVTMLPAVDRMKNSKVLRMLALILLMFSVISATYPARSPWTSPWIHKLMKFIG